MKTLLDTSKLHIFLDENDLITVDTRLGRAITLPLNDFIDASNALAEMLRQTPTIEITDDQLRLALGESESDDGDLESSKLG